MTTPSSYEEVANRFALVAREFCSAIDSAPQLDRIELLTRVYRTLPRLIDEATRLPDLELSDDESREEEIKKSQARVRVRLGHTWWRELYECLRAKLDDWDLYWEVWDPTKDNEAIHGSLADDFADIYRDLRGGLSLTEETTQVLAEESIWHWRFLYYSHWGKHAIDALRTIHFLLEGTLS